MKHLPALLFCVFFVFTASAFSAGGLTVSINGQPASVSYGTAAGVWHFWGGKSQVLILGFPNATRDDGTVGPLYRVVAEVGDGETIELNGPTGVKTITKSGALPVTTENLEPQRPERTFEPIACFPDLPPALAEALIEWDWRLQDGINTPREARSYREAIARMAGPASSEVSAAPSPLTEADWETLWRTLHQKKRERLLARPEFQTGALLFVKHVPSAMSHQLTQVYGYAARPGGGLFVLEEPGKSFRTRQLAANAFPTGNFMKSDISPDGKTIYTAFCACDSAPKEWRDSEKMAQRYQIWAMDSDGKNVRQLTRGEADSFAPCVSPTGEIIYLSTLRGTFHRCGGGPCYLYTLTLMNADGSAIRPISFHETNEWDPTVLENGRILYTRWDYVDRNAVHYQNLWQTRLDGTDVRIFYGNNTFVPCGIWEARQVPNSSKVMAIGGPHHGLSAGSVILVDPSKGVDGPEPIERLTPDVAYPETEAPLAGGRGYVDFDSEPAKNWYSSQPGVRLPESESQRRWPGQTFKAPFPLSEECFIASYSYDRLFGEVCANIPNHYGLYFCDRWGNRELIYRDANISSLWAIPLTPPKRRIYSDFRPYVVTDAVPPVVSRWEIPRNVFGTILMQNVYDGTPKLPEETKIKALRIVQVLPKSTPHANQPMLGFANASPGKQVLGTVPVEEDGSAFFELPACVPVLFQALDEQGRAVQTMRSLTYVQPGENANCIGCHEDRMKTPEPSARQPLAGQREPSKIVPGPDGSRPFSYVRLVQPVWDQHCVKCHNAEEPNGIDLTGTLDGQYTKSYSNLRPFVVWSAWGNPENNFEPLTPIGKVGTFASRLTQYLEPAHHNVQLSPEEKERVYIWMDAGNSLFYGTFKVEDQARQQRGEIIEGPDAE